MSSLTSSVLNLAKPKLFELHQQTDLLPNISYVVQCLAHSGSKPIDFSWTKDGRRLSSTTTTGTRVDQSESMSQLTFDNVQPIDSGHYTCSASNRFGIATTSTQLIVKGLLPNYPLPVSGSLSGSLL